MKTTRKNNSEKGDFIEWLLMLLALSVVIFAILIPKSGRQLPLGFPDLSGGWAFLDQPARTSTYTGTTGGSNSASEPAITAAGSVSSANIPQSSSAGSIRISTGNAKYEKDPMSEYITIENRSQKPINITGWRLENGKSARVYSVGSQAVHYASDTAIIPQGAKIISPIGANIMESIVLNPGEKAVVVTGGPGNQSPRLVSFKENLCTGYLAETYSFPMGLDTSCVRPSVEPGSSGLDSQCRTYLSSMRSCHAPEYGGLDNQGERCDGCVDGRTGLSGLCQNFIKSHFSYKGCLANHSSDANFEGRTWHVYLHRPWEMWDSSYEKISLYDSSGGLVAELNY
jgi:hypothetical protein